ncbi:glycosyltransferase family 10 domain-containing protein [Flavobacterium tyrosinilyticum]|uniref:glycosyltransferase family 10 domain-containing protein n=1 Tax=Flavobacterium tyrosinilyticum TaxID=1658740 RepID=UPI00203099BD|nr:glycosyltransferase family 10 [Flavobacterium tyrosinilyticum]MCM0668634.1 glycosyltransferase family 10 [Flavobacterium tyrosinilyticum]
MIIKLERYFSYPDLKRQTPNNSMKWKDFTFTEDDIDECDYLVILEYPKEDFSIKVNENNILHLCLEPPNEISKYRQYANKKTKLVYNQLDIKKNNILSHGALPWHVNKDYDFLSELKAESLEKENTIVWITSNQRTSKGHNTRMDFLENIQNLPFVNLYGRGIKPIDDKWDVLDKSKYAIAYENFQSDYYWTEKIIDCFLSFTMPLYFGCNAIENFFPKNSFIQIDPNDKHIDLFLKEIVNSAKWEDNLEAISEARELILNKYQLFPFLYNQIKDLELRKGDNLSLKKTEVHFKGGNDYFDNYPISVAIEKQIIKVVNKVGNKFK